MLFTIMFGFYTMLHKHNRIRNIYLLAFSLFFYYKCSGFYFILLLISTLLDYIFGFKIFNSNGWRRRFFLVLSIAIVEGIIFLVSIFTIYCLIKKKVITKNFKIYIYIFGIFWLILILSSLFLSSNKLFIVE